MSRYVNYKRASACRDKFQFILPMFADFLILEEALLHLQISLSREIEVFVEKEMFHKKGSVLDYKMQMLYHSKQF